VQVIVGVVIIIFGLSMWELFDIPLFNFIKLPVHRKNSYFSAFFLGLSSGLVISPCLTPVLGAILTYLTTQKNLLYGGILLFSFAYGMGAVLILVGTFSAILPKPGKWSLYIKKAGGAVLLIMGLYLILNAITRG
jgi:thiol:disulfide interchange protein DsbD